MASRTAIIIRPGEFGTKLNSVKLRSAYGAIEKGASIAVAKVKLEGAKRKVHKGAEQWGAYLVPSQRIPREKTIETLAVVTSENIMVMAHEPSTIWKWTTR